MTVHYKTDNQKPALLRVPASSNVVQKLGLSPINRVAEVKNHVKCIMSSAIFYLVEVRGLAPRELWVIIRAPHYATPTILKLYQYDYK